MLIFDEVFVGFRLAPGGAQEYFGVQGRHGHLRQDAGRRAADRRAVRPARADAALSRRAARRHLLRARHVQLAPLRDGGDARVPAAARDAGDPRPLPRSRSDLGRARRAPESAACSKRSAGAGREPVDDLDGLLHATVSLQLDAAILSARRRAGVELGGHRPLHLQPQLHRGRLRRRRRPLRGRRARHAAGRLLVVEPRR